MMPSTDSSGLSTPGPDPRSTWEEAADRMRTAGLTTDERCRVRDVVETLVEETRTWRGRFRYRFQEAQDLKLALSRLLSSLEGRQPLDPGTMIREATEVLRKYSR